jgi:hypothetical protein
MTIAKTILTQIKTLDPMALFAWGAKDLVNIGNGLQFRSSGMAKWKGNVVIRYNEATDLYDIEFIRIRAGVIKKDASSEGVFAEDLIRFIDAQVQ